MAQCQPILETWLTLISFGWQAMIDILCTQEAYTMAKGVTPYVVAGIADYQHMMICEELSILKTLDMQSKMDGSYDGWSVDGYDAFVVWDTAMDQIPRINGLTT